MKKWYAVIGDPIHQSMSPTMHDGWFTEHDLQATYIPIQVTKESLSQAVASLRALGCSGWNVTVPHKSAIIPFLDEIDASAEAMNAVNTVEVLKDGSLRGSNTDGQGFVQSLEEAYGEQAKGKEVLVIGAGGAARGISYALHNADYGPITFTNRTIEKANVLAEAIPNASTLSLLDAETEMASFGLIVQTTSVGMNFAQAGLPVNPENIKKNTIVAEIIYNPLETQLLREAKTKGASTMNGVGMFVHQGALAFETWTGIKPDTEAMIRKITEKLGGSIC